MVIYVLFPVSDSHTKCACVPAIHPHPWAPGSRTALHQGASVSFTVTLVTDTITQEEEGSIFSFSTKEKNSFWFSWRRTEACSLRTGDWALDDGLFCCFASFLSKLPSDLVCSMACFQRPFPTTRSNQPTGFIITFLLKCISNTLRAGSQMDYSVLPFCSCLKG